jgi:hypothetical protein
MKNAKPMAVEFVINVGGGFGLSEAAVRRARDLGAEWAKEIVLRGEAFPDGMVNDSGYGSYGSDLRDAARTDPVLVQVVRELGRASWGESAELVVKRYRLEVEVNEEEDGGADEDPHVYLVLDGEERFGRR